ncbi:cupin domain-containing protein [Bradyrhizobium erythrophlei]|jgi:quercetin dioxygenase-like cupin family protein|uniref:Cupin domain-containing protein n=1 Tax=Bradyrhizobium erythrophlei TaxID=1437360 RepID=A0A1M7U7E7_9BRAD|nr:cupin domain-containing protein [Bradyrhizobium erythrophlei]SHN78959.1 Cupin domain-containing protein [Bradyrhizobium erythrophlei]
MNIRAACAAILALTLFGGVCSQAHAQSQAKVARSEKLPNVPGKSVTAVVVTFPPGAKSPPHHHAGSVLVYVLSGEVRSENSATGPAKVYKAGETFFEPAGSAHLVSENVSATEPATILAVFIADDGATLTTIDH